MLFNTFNFWIFFAVVFAFYCALNHRWQNRLLLAASYYFYGCWDYRFLSLIAFTTLADFYIGAKIAKTSEPRQKKQWLLLSVVMNLTLLGFFKYFNFFVESAQTLLSNAGFHPAAWVLEIVVPPAISFYTFHEISYTVDVYRGHVKPARGLIDFAAFISFFPQLVMGPIGRASWQLPQFENPRRMTWDGWCDGTALILFGLFKKLCVADLLAPMATQTFADPAGCSPATLLFGLYCFSIQIYTDFSGYTDIARGLAKLMGFELIENFNHPYFSANITEFWRRWHISLSTWLRDYLYLPLGGNRFGAFKTYRNLFLTMFLGGLWHGAAWTYVIWGSLHGIYLALHKYMLRGTKPAEIPPKDGFKNFSLYLLKVIFTFHLVTMTWIFFQPRSLSLSFQYLAGLWPFGLPMQSIERVHFDIETVSLALWSVAALVFLIEIPQYIRRDHCAMRRWSFALKTVGFATLTLWLIMTREIENVPFIYFKF